MKLSSKSRPRVLFITLSVLLLAALLVSVVSAAAVTVTVDSSADVGYDSSLVLNSSGFPVISYYDLTNGDLKLAVCGDAACASKTVSTVDSGGVGDVGEYSSLVLNSLGNPVISYYDWTTTDLKVAVCGDATCSSKTITTVDSTGSVGQYTSLVLNSSGFPVISYYSFTSQFLKLAVCTNVDCTSKTLTNVDGILGATATGLSTGNLGQYTSMELNSSGFPIISYYDASASALRVVVCGDATCSTGTATVIDSVGTVGKSTSVELNSSGFPVIAYYDETNGDLKLAVCANATCSSSAITVVDNSIGAAPLEVTSSSLILNSLGNPVISYHDIANGDLKVVVCGNADCSSGNTTTIMDSSGDVGAFTSLALDSSGNPVVSYFDATNGDLKLAMSDTIPPTVLMTSIVTDPTSVSPILVTVTFSESVTGFAIGDIVPGNGTVSNFIAVNATTYTFDLTPIAPGLITANIAAGVAVDLANNGNLVAPQFSRTYENKPPTVTSTSLLAIYVTTGPGTFTVTFSENVSTAGGAGGVDSATNPNNYQVINKGTNGSLDTGGCASPLGGDDSRITVTGVTYNSAAWTSTVTLSAPLPVGNYYLFVCGTTSIVDLALNALAGNGLTSGTDYNFNFVAIAPIPGGGGGGFGRDEGDVTSSLPSTGFAPFKVTELPAQPANAAYSNLGSIWLEIPSQDVRANIVGVQKNSTSWDISWLGNSVGWLNGTAFPTWDGNSVLTAHVYNSNGLPGPFVDIKSLKYGNQIIIHLYGGTYIYEVRKTRLVRPETKIFALEHLEGASYLTLITCQEYNEQNNIYIYRRVVRAVLVEIK